MSKNVLNTKKVVFLTINKFKEVKVNEYTFSEKIRRKDIVTFLKKQDFNPEMNEKYISLLP